MFLRPMSLIGLLGILGLLQLRLLTVEASVCDGCAAGRFYSWMNSVCTDCLPGYSCSGGCNNATACASGRFADGGDSSCSTCSSGYMCPTTTSSTQIQCVAGTMSYSGATTCSSCAPGYACSSTIGSGSAVACSAGTFSTGGQSSCTECPAGYACSSTTSALMNACNAGYYSLGSVDSCTQCPAGYHCPSRGAAPKECPAGTYSAAGAVVCTTVPAGYYTASSASGSYTQCAIGSYSSGGASSCSDCSPGYMCPAGSTSPSPLGSACAIGGYCSSATSWTYTSCPSGRYGVTAAGQTLSHACKSCEPGYYCPTQGGTIEDRVICGAGGYCDFGSSGITGCPAGYYSSDTGQTSVGTCKKCPAGSYCLYSGTSAPTTCPAHYFCPSGTSDYTTTPCAAGMYSDITGLHFSSECNNCTVGHYCPGDESPVPCPAGRYNPFKGISNLYDCKPCEMGYACTSTGMSSSLVTTCAAGHYCPAGTSASNEYPCPAGRYSDNTNNVGFMDCTVCPAGSTCPAGAQSGDIAACPTGSYCPEGTQTGQASACPPGTYTAATYLVEVSQCSSCPAGYYCSGGASATSGACAQGHYCPVNTTSATDYPCPAGTYTASTSLESEGQCTAADPGAYAVEASPAQTNCPAGRYSGVTNTEDWYASAGTSVYCQECAAGYYCIAGVSVQTPCGTGSYSAAGSSACTTCPAGTYCSSTTTTADNIESDGGTWANAADLSGVCFNGTLCPSAGRTDPPDLTDEACPAGYYCPSGSSVATACPAGTYNPLTGKDALDDCITTEAGYYSSVASTATTGLCYPGFYCEAGSTGPSQLPCLPGTYRSEYGGTSSSDCGNCPPGSYCPTASVTPLLCPRGYYCPAGSSEPEPCYPGTYGNVAGLNSDDECTACDPGYYCDTFALQAPSGLCSPGFYCLSGQNTSTPTNPYSSPNVTSDVCPTGHYCPIGTVLPIDCPEGTFNDAQGGDSSADCASCTPGYYCTGTGNTHPTGECTAGYYCTGGATVPTQYQVSAGHYSLAAAVQEEACVQGSYQPNVGQSDCDDCPAGSFCPNTGMNNITNTPCTVGNYCPLSSVLPTKCVIGKYLPYTGSDEESDCLDCPGGYYCDTQGIYEPTGLCDAGYYCTGAATSAIQATDTATGGRCPTGNYCVQGTATAQPCPAGEYMATLYNEGNVTWTDMNGTAKTTFCTPCDNGDVCTTTGLSAPDGTCGAGYWCNLGAYQSAADCIEYLECGAMYDICPLGKVCAAGSSEPLNCSPGYYTAAVGQSTCIDCPAGYYCLGDGNQPTICPAGSYCPLNTRYGNQYTCPVGTYGSSEGLDEQSDCSDCAAGLYCPDTSGVPAGNCSAGYFCSGGSSTATPADSAGTSVSYLGDTCVNASKSNANDVCPYGHYCPEGSIAPTPCPPGRLSPAKGLGELLDCPNCTAGNYCPYGAMVDNELQCPAGEYCPEGSFETTICPGGFYCPLGSSTPTSCTAGYYCPEGSSVETICPAGHYCDSEVATYTMCAAGYVCPEGSTSPTSCPGGTYQPTAGRDTGCLSCDEGYYCPEASTAITVCPIGSFCPTNSSINTICTNGTYGNATGFVQQEDCTDCPAQQYCHSGAIQGDCEAGYFCKGGSDSATPDANITAYNTSLIGQMYYLKSLDNAQCPPGYYCPKGNVDPIPCPDGRVYEYTTASSAADCGDCPAGYYCLDGNPTPVLCDLGYYCPHGTTQETQIGCPEYTYGATYGLMIAGECTTCPAGYACNSTGISDYTNWPCPVGYYCPGATDPVPCPAGTYAPNTGYNNTNQCISCPLYSYCPSGSANISPCPQGYYCPAGVGAGIVCPAGYYCPTNTSTPLDCPATYYCGVGSYAPTQCWVGTYCPANSIAAYNCPAGYIGINASGLAHLSAQETACEACAAGKYGADPNRLTCTPGEPGWIYYGGTTRQYPVNVTSDRGEPCPAGYWCPANSTAGIPCAAGTYQPVESAVSIDACINCPANSYSTVAGSAACSSCSASSAAAAGATECSCTGNNRAFQADDGYCICKPGYEFVDIDFTVQSEEDGSVDCQPIVYDRCSADQTRNSEGDCVDTYNACDSFCGASGGEVSSTTGLCICDSITPLAEVCDASCRDTSSKIECYSTTTLKITDASGVEETMLISDYTPSSGAIDCSVSGAKLITMDVSGGSFTGVFGAAPSITAAARRSRNRRRLLEAGEELFSESVGQHLSNTSVDAVYKGRSLLDIEIETIGSEHSEHRRLSDGTTLSNTVVCVELGDSIVFSVDNSNYPVYVKDSLLNTNDDFDYSAFRELSELAASSSLSVTSFVHTFDEAGSYVFQLSSNSDMVTVVSVVGTGLACTTDSHFDVMSSGTLVTLGVTTSDSIVLAPDWALLIGLILGIVLVVIVIVSFIYYFRKRAWAVSMDLHNKHRAKASIEPSKGGIFSDRNQAKVVPTITDFDEEARRPDVAEEVERAMALQDHVDVDFDDDMLIPELAKHVQAQHDDVAKRLDKTQGDVKGLQDTLTKEVDDLKALLTSTAMQMTSAGGSESAKIKKLRALLLQVKKNTGDRSAYAGKCAVMETQLTTLIAGLKRLVDVGAMRTAQDIVVEVNDGAIDAYEKGEKTEDYFSSIYDNIKKDLEEISSFFKTVQDDVESEARAVKVADDAFEDGVKAAQVAFPQNIRDLMTVAAQAMVEEGDKEGQILNLMKAFVDRQPRFLYSMDAAKGVLGRSLKTHIEEGHQANAEEDKMNATNEMSGYLNDLIAALVLMKEKISERISASESIREDANNVRSELMAAIDAELGFLGGGIGEGDINKLLKALKSGGLANLGGAGSDGEDENDSDGEEVEDGDTLGALKAPERSNTEIDDDIFDDIDQSTKLDADKKEELLVQAQNDQALAQANIDREEQRKADMLAALEEEARLKEEQSKAEEAAADGKEEEELQDLQRSQEETRQDKLRDLERQEYSASLETGDAPHDVRVSTIATNRYVTTMRCHAADARVSYYELGVEFSSKRAAAALECTKKTFKSSKSAVAGLKTDTVVAHGALLAINDVDEAQRAIDAEEAAAAEKLKRRLEARLDKALVAEDKNKAEWMKDTSIVNADEEVIKLRTKCLDVFKKLHERRETCTKKHIQAAQNECDVQLAILNIKAKTEGFDDERMKFLEDAFALEENSRIEAAQQSSGDLGRILEAEEYTLGHILNLADSWGPKVDRAALQRDLFERVKYDIGVDHDIRARMALCEQDLRNDMTQVKSESELNKRSAEKKEVELVLANLQEAAIEKMEVLRKSLEKEGKAKNEEERARAEGSVKGYEAERCEAILNGSYNAFRLQTDLDASLRTISDEIKATQSKKKEDLLVSATQQEMTDHIKKLAVQQIDEECLQEEASLQATYAVLAGEAAIMRRCSAEVAQGVYPSVNWGEKEIQEYCVEQLANLKESLVHKIVRQTFKRTFSVERVKVFENMRLMVMGRSVDDLDKIYERLDEQKAERIDLLRNEFSQNLLKLEEQCKSQQRDMQDAHADFHDDVYMVSSDHEAAMEKHDADFAGKMEEIEHDGTLDDDAKELALLKCKQENACGVGNLLTDMESKIFAAFKKHNARVYTMERIEDDLRQLATDIENNAEAIENALDNERNAKFRDILAQQIEARNKQRELRDQYDMEVNGLDEVMKAKKEKQKKFLADRLAKRKKKREQELLDEGLSAAQAKTIAAEENASEMAQQQKVLDAATDDEEKKLRRKLVDDDEELENVVMEAYKRAMSISEDGLAGAKKKAKDALEARLRAKREKRLKELKEQGMSDLEAKKQVAAELKAEAQQQSESLDSDFAQSAADLQKGLSALAEDEEGVLKDALRNKIAEINKDSSLSEDEKRAAIKEAQEKFDADTKRYLEQQELARKILDSGLDAAKTAAHKSLMDRLAKKKNMRVEELKAQGMSDADANAQADREFAAETEKEEEKLNDNFKIAKAMLETGAADDWGDRMAKIKQDHENKVNGLNKALEYNKSTHAKNLQDRLNRRKALREQRLAADGLTSDEIKEKVAKEFEKAEEACDEDKVGAKLKEDASAAVRAKKESMERMDKSMDKEEGAQAVSDDDDVVKMLERQLAETKAKLEEAYNRGNAEYEAAASAAKSTDNTTDELAKLRKEHDSAVEKLNNDFATKKRSSDEALKRKLSIRRKMKTEQLRAQNDNKVDANAAPSEVKAALDKQEDAVVSALQSDLDAAISAVQNDDSLSAAEKTKKIEQLEANFREEMERVKKEHDRALSILDEGLANAKDKSRRSLKDRLARKHAVRKNELVAQGKSDAEADKQADQELTDAAAVEEQTLDAAFAEANGLIEGATAPKLSEDEIEKKVTSTMVAEEDKMRKAREIQASIDKEKALAELNRKQADLEKAILERTQAEAELAAAKASRAEADANAQLANLHKKQEEEASRLHNEMEVQKRKNGDDLKKRLREKKAAKMRALEASQASDKEKAEEEAKLEEEAHQQEVLAEKIAKEDETRRLAALKQQQDAAEEEARKKVSEAQTAAAVAATKAAAIESIAETQKKQEDELNQRELDRLKSLQQEMAAKAKADADAKQAGSKGKLADRIKAKRAKKEKDLKDKEAAERTALAAKQEAEAKQKEELRLSKLKWTEHLEEAIARAKEQGISEGSDFEDYCIQETITRGLVPPQHLAECVGKILGGRHHAETAALMSKNFDTRITAMKAANASILEDKNIERVELVKKLQDANASDEEQAKQLKQLESTYETKQKAAEQKAVAVIEQENMQAQMALRQKQLEEISKLVSMHSDPEVMSQLGASEGKSMVEEMSEYRAKLEKDKKEREEALAAERQAEEERMKAKMDADLAEMKEKLQAEAKAHEQEFARKKAEMEKNMAKNRADLEAQEAAANNEVDKAAAAQKKEQFEKENAAALKDLDNEKKKKKDKLAERLAAKRNKKKAAAAGAGAILPPEQPPTADIAESAEAVAASGGSPRESGAVSAKKSKKWSESAAVAKAVKKKTKAAAEEMGVSPQLVDSLGTITQRMDKIEGILTKLASVGVPAPAAGAPAPALASDASPAAMQGPVFSDIAEPPIGASLKLVDDRSLHVQQKARLDFGRTLGSLLGMGDVNLVAADSLPPPQAPLQAFGTGGSEVGNTNAFARSYAYDPDTKELAMHTDRLGSSGDFGLVCIHALSHIKVAPYDITNDNDPKFKAEFYKNLKVLSQDLYRQQSRAKKDLGSEASRAERQANKLSSMKRMGSKLLDVVKSSSKGHVDPEKLPAGDKLSSEQDYFSSDSMATRLMSYANNAGVNIPSDFYERYKKGETGIEQPVPASTPAADNTVTPAPEGSKVDA